MRQIDDKDYIECLPSGVYVKNYLRFKNRIEPHLEEFVKEMRSQGVKVAMDKFSLTKRELGLMVRLGYLLEDEIEEFSLHTYGEVVII